MRVVSKLAIAATILFAAYNSTFAQSTNIILDDTWAGGTYTNWNLPSQSPWYFNTSASNVFFIGAVPGSMIMTNYDGANSATKTYWTYFTTNDPALTVSSSTTTNIISNSTNTFYGHPIDLANGETLLARLTFIPTGEFLDNGTSGVRFGLLSYDHADSGRCLRNTPNISKSGTNVTGYRVQVPIYLHWPNNAVIALHVRTNISTITDSQDPMGKAGDWFSLGASPTFTNNEDAFQDGKTYTLDFSVTHYATSNVISSTLSGPLLDAASTNLTRTTVDTTGSNYHKFDCYMVRVDTAALAADQFICKEFLVEKISPVTAVAPFRITSVASQPGNQVVLRWDSVSGQTYQVQSENSLNASWITNATVTASSTSTSWTNTGLGAISQRFYRVVATP